jgi:uncharacterized Zn-finger protein
MGRRTPSFFNDLGAPILVIGTKKFKCIGASPPFDHPHIYLDMGNDGEIVCPYCSTLFRYNASVGDLDASPIFEPQVQNIQQPPPTSVSEGLTAPNALIKARNLARRTLRRVTDSRIVRFFIWYFLLLIIEAPIAKLFEFIAELSPEWLQKVGEFQKDFVMAVDQLQPWRLYEVYISQPVPDTISQNLVLFLELFRARQTISQLVGSPDKFVGVLSAVGFIASLISSWYLMVMRPARRHDAAGYLLLWLVLGIPLSVVIFSMTFFLLKAMLGFGVWMLGRLVELAELYSTFAIFVALLFAARVRTEHAIVHWLEHLLDHIGKLRRRRGPEPWEDPVV